MKSGKIRDYLYLTFLLVTPLVAFLLPADFFDNGPTICPSKLFFNVECLGCGMTRAVMHLIHFDFDSAVYYNKGSLIIAPAIAAVWVFWIRKAVVKVTQKPVEGV